MGEHYTFLLADDDPQLQAAVKRVAEAHGHTLIQTLTIANLVERVSVLRPHLIILDLKFHNADGRDALAKLKSHPTTRDIPVLVWSGRLDPDQKRQALELGAEDFVEKFDAQTLMRKVERVMLHSLGPSVSATHRIETAAEQDEATRAERTA